MTAPENLERTARETVELARFVTRRLRARAQRRRAGGGPGLGGKIEVCVGDVSLRPLRRSDRESWVASMKANEARMTPWWTLPAGWTDDAADEAFYDHWLGWTIAHRRGSGQALAIVGPDGLIGEVQLYHRSGGRAAEAGVWCTAGKVSTRSLCTAFHAVIDTLILDLGIERLDAPVASGNLQPLLLLSRCGFAREGTLEGWRPLHGEMVDMEMYGLTRERWLEHRTRLAEAGSTRPEPAGAQPA